MKQRITILLFAFALCATSYSYAQEVVESEELGKTDVVRTDSTGMDRTQAGDTTWTEEDEIYQGDTIYIYHRYHHSSSLKRGHRHHGKTFFEKSKERRHRAKQKKAREARRERMSRSHRSSHHSTHHSSHSSHSSHRSGHSSHHSSHHGGRR